MNCKHRNPRFHLLLLTLIALAMLVPSTPSQASSYATKRIWGYVDGSFTDILLRGCGSSSMFQFRAEQIAPEQQMSAIYTEGLSEGCSPDPRLGWKVVLHSVPGEQFRIYSQMVDVPLSETDFMQRASRDICRTVALGSVTCVPEANTQPRMTIASPTPGQAVQGIVNVTGWAVDLATLSGSGVSEVSVRGRTAAGEVFQATASYGQARSDVAAFFGDSRFTNSGYTFSFDSHTIPNGALTLRIEAKSSVSQQWTAMERSVTVANALAQPNITSITTNSTVANAGNLPVIIRGEHFQAPISARIGNVELQDVNLESDTVLHAVVPVSSLSVGVYSLTVTSAGIAVTLPNAFTVTPAVPETQFRIMVYLACDNDLQPQCWHLFNQLELAAARQPDARIVALWDGPKEHDSRYYWVQPDSKPTLATYTPDVNVFPQDEVDTGDPSTLIEFVIWAQSKFPGQYKFLSLVGHGGGWAPYLPPSQPQHIPTQPSNGVGGMLEDKSSFSTMSTAKMAEALKWIADGYQIDTLYLDACLMSTSEVVAELRPYAHYIVAHENLTWALYPYADYLQGISSTTTPRDLAQHIADSIRSSWQQNGNLLPSQVTVIDTTQVPAVLEKLSALADALSAVLPTQRDVIDESARAAAHVDENDDGMLTPNDRLLDLADFSARLMEQAGMDSRVKAAAQAVQSAVGGAVVVNYRLSGIPGRVRGQQWWDLEPLRGLSVYFPLKDEWRRRYYGPFALPEFATKTNWDEFIQAWYAGQVPPAPPSGGCPECPTYPRHIALQLESTAGGSVGQAVYLPVRIYGLTATDDLRGIQISVAAADTHILEPAADLQPRMGSFLPASTLKTFMRTASGWDVILNLPFSATAPVAGSGVVVELPFRVRSTACVDVGFQQDVLTDREAEPLNHQAIDARVGPCNGPANVTGTTYLESRTTNRYIGTRVVLRGAGGIYVTTTNALGAFSLGGVPPGNYTAQFSHDLFVEAERAVTVRAGATTTLPSVGLWGGDVNQDQRVNNRDWRICAAASIPVADRAFDLNGDGVTDVRDCTIVANNIGRPNMQATNPPEPGASAGTASAGSALPQSTIATTQAIRLRSQPDGTVLVQVESAGAAFYGVGARLRLPAGTHVIAVEPSDPMEEEFLQWRQEGDMMYIIAARDDDTVSAADADLALIRLELPAGSTTEDLTVEAANLILATSPRYSVYLPWVQR